MEENFVAQDFAGLVTRFLQLSSSCVVNDLHKRSSVGEISLIRSLIEARASHSDMSVDLDAWIEKLKRCEHLAEDELKALCEYVRSFPQLRNIYVDDVPCDTKDLSLLWSFQIGALLVIFTLRWSNV